MNKRFVEKDVFKQILLGSMLTPFEILCKYGRQIL